MSDSLKTYKPSGTIYAKPVRAHEFVPKGRYEGINTTSTRAGANDSKKCPSVINGELVYSKQP